MAVVDAWSEAVRNGGIYAAPTQQAEPKKENKTMLDRIFTVIAIRNPSLPEQQQGIGTVVLCGPQTLPASSSAAACAQFGAANADAIKNAPAGLLEIGVKEGM